MSTYLCLLPMSTGIIIGIFLSKTMHTFSLGLKQGTLEVAFRLRLGKHKFPGSGETILKDQKAQINVKILFSHPKAFSSENLIGRTRTRAKKYFKRAHVRENASHAHAREFQERHAEKMRVWQLYKMAFIQNR